MVLGTSYIFLERKVRVGKTVLVRQDLLVMTSWSFKWPYLSYW